jgi:predicted helicase
MPFYLFKPQDTFNLEQYEKGWSLKDIFNVQSVGIVTAKDELLIGGNYKVLETKIKKFAKAEDIRQVREWFDLPTSYNDKIKKTLENLQKQPYQIREIAYRPFEKRFIWWETDFIERAREKTMQLFDKPNLALVTVRQVKSGDTWQHSLVSKFVTESTFVSNRTSEIGYVFPCYYHNGSTQTSDGQMTFLDENGKKSNFTKAFKEFILEQYPDKQTDIRAIFNYIYAYEYLFIIIK